METYSRIVNNFFHDMATGTWAASFMVLAVLAHRATGAPASALAILREVAWLMFWMVVAALGIIGVTGGLRLRYWRREATSDEVAAKRRILIAKHVAFALVYGPGTALAWRLVSAM